MNGPHPSDAWVECGCGQRHWGRFGAAGLLLHHRGGGGAVVLQHRVGWSHHGGTWALPGGALLPGESVVAGALRESAEEAGTGDGAGIGVRATSVLTHPDWSYTTVLADAVERLDVRATDPEGVEVRWVGLDGVAALPLLPAFGEAWPTLRTMIVTRPVVVVDAANVVGSRPDGWWRDRAGAARRLLAGVRALADDGVPAAFLGLPGTRWWPDWHVVLEGAARDALEGTDATDGAGVGAVVVHRAAGSGDDEIVRVGAGLGGDVVVVTADRELRERVGARGARSVGPGSLRELLSS